VRHTPDGTPIEVGAHVDGGAGIVRVRDHGPGLAPEAVDNVFDRFWQADRARVGTAFGLGLSIVAGIAAEHGGTASASNADDGGAVFTIRIPLDPAGERP
jgi:signal transduction histidine kinase